jgi:hypothetical protein
MPRITEQAVLKTRDLAFLAVAIAMHAVLLLLPLKAWQLNQPAVSDRLTVNLRPNSQPAKPAPQMDPEPAPEPTAGQASPPAEKPAFQTDQRKPAMAFSLEEIPPPAGESPGQKLDSRQLRHLAEQADLTNQNQGSRRQLGSASEYQAPANWNRHAGAPFFAGFDSRSHVVTLPEDVEIADRWQAADGSHQVVVNLPSGEMMCGRSEAYNPMQPLVEPIMMFTICGKKATFTVPEHFKKGQ